MGVRNFSTWSMNIHRALKMTLRNLYSFFKKNRNKSTRPFCQPLPSGVWGSRVPWASAAAVFPGGTASPAVFRAGSCADVLSALRLSVMPRSAG